ncbi:MAG: hypothetical protein PHS17_04295 [Desulfobacterales bacterium]|nr:hypothetical protein [Desulfobacterales bacterium]
MPAYIVCRKKRNNPRIDVRICELKCSMKEECVEFKANGKNGISEQSSNTGAETVELEAA